ncbi:MAG: hypothetical protein ACI8T1_002224, partial [Verrucomicrobiales bacterium]
MVDGWRPAYGESTKNKEKPTNHEHPITQTATT